jgi:hypothetical protein
VVSRDTKIVKYTSVQNNLTRATVIEATASKGGVGSHEATAAPTTIINLCKSGSIDCSDAESKTRGAFPVQSHPSTERYVIAQ